MPRKSVPTRHPNHSLTRTTSGSGLSATDTCRLMIYRPLPLSNEPFLAPRPVPLALGKGLSLDRQMAQPPDVLPAKREPRSRSATRTSTAAAQGVAGRLLTAPPRRRPSCRRISWDLASAGRRRARLAAHVRQDWEPRVDRPQRDGSAAAAAATPRASLEVPRTRRVGAPATWDNRLLARRPVSRTAI